MSLVGAGQLFAIVIALAGGWAGAGVASRFTGADRKALSWILIPAMAGLVAWSWWSVPAELLPASCCLAWALLVLGTVDAIAFRLPDAITLPLTATGLLVAWAQGGMLSSAIGAAAGYGAFAGLAWLYRMLRGRDGLGLGDAKLAAAAGAWLGWAALPVFILVACAGGFVWAAASAMYARRGLHHPLPFGVPIAMAFWLMWLYGPVIEALQG